MTTTKPQIQATFGEDISGARVLTGIRYYYPEGDTVPLGGITARKLRDISYWSLLKNSYEDSNSTLSPEEEERLLILVRDHYPSKPGRVPIPEIYLAGMAYLFDKHLRTTPRNPVASLAETLGLSPRTVAQRIRKAKSLGHITTGVAIPGGKARGQLSTTAEEIIRDHLSR